MTDLQLIEALKKGDESCFKYLYDYLPDVKRFIRQNSGNEDDAKDLLQEAAITFYINLKNGKYTHTNLKGYILTIVRNQWFDRLDKQKRERTKRSQINKEEVQEAIQFEINKPRRALGQYLQDALDKIGEPCKALIVATVYVKTKMDQVATQFGLANAKSARQQKLRCLNRLRSLTSYTEIIDLT